MRERGIERLRDGEILSHSLFLSIPLSFLLQQISQMLDGFCRERLQWLCAEIV